MSILNREQMDEWFNGTVRPRGQERSISFADVAETARAYHDLRDAVLAMGRKRNLIAPAEVAALVARVERGES